MDKQAERVTVRMKIQRLLKVVLLYLDDLLALSAGGCFVAAAYDLFGPGLAKAVAGVCFLGYAIVVAKARKEG